MRRRFDRIRKRKAGTLDKSGLDISRIAEYPAHMQNLQVRELNMYCRLSNHFLELRQQGRLEEAIITIKQTIFFVQGSIYLDNQVLKTEIEKCINTYEEIGDIQGALEFLKSMGSAFPEYDQWTAKLRDYEKNL